MSYLVSNKHVTYNVQEILNSGYVNLQVNKHVFINAILCDNIFKHTAPSFFLNHDANNYFVISQSIIQLLKCITNMFASEMSNLSKERFLRT